MKLLSLKNKKKVVSVHQRHPVAVSLLWTWWSVATSGVNHQLEQLTVDDLRLGWAISTVILFMRVSSCWLWLLEDDSLVLKGWLSLWQITWPWINRDWPSATSLLLDWLSSSKPRSQAAREEATNFSLYRERIWCQLVLHLSEPCSCVASGAGCYSHMCTGLESFTGHELCKHTGPLFRQTDWRMQERQQLGRNSSNSSSSRARVYVWIWLYGAYRPWVGAE